jgi:hypothetical protein
VISALLTRALRPDSGIFRKYLAEHPGGWIERLKTLVLGLRADSAVDRGAGSRWLLLYGIPAYKAVLRVIRIRCLIVLLGVILAFNQRACIAWCTLPHDTLAPPGGVLRHRCTQHCSTSASWRVRLCLEN